MKEKVVIIGGGFGGLALAGMLAKKGKQVMVLEKNEQPGGRAGVLRTDGFVFDMGPSWYLMPDIFEQYFRLMGERIEDHLDLRRLDPSYRIHFEGSDPPVDITSDLERDLATFERIEPGSAAHVRSYLARAAEQYRIAVDQFLYSNYDSLLQFLRPRNVIQALKMSVLSSMDRYVRRFFRTEKLQKIFQYALVFLGSSPYNTPALYSIMSHIDMTQGVFYPMGGMGTVRDALAAIAAKHGAALRMNAPVRRIHTIDGKAVAVELESGEHIDADIVVSNADIHHTETALLAESDRSYTSRYWETRVLAPSALVLYLGIEGKAPSLTHHNLRFSDNWKANFAQIFDTPALPNDPSFYVCAPSVTDPTVAPAGQENLFVLVPIASGLSDDDAALTAYADRILAIIEREMGVENLVSRIRVREMFCVRDFEERYNSFKGTALGLAHTLRQTAVFRPRNRSKKIANLYYVGGNTLPGIGMPMCLISAELAYKRIVGITSSAPLPPL